MLKKIVWLACFVSFCAFCGCGDDKKDSGDKQGSNTGAGTGTNTKKCQCEDSDCDNCATIVASCKDETHITIENKIDGYDGNTHVVRNNSNTKQCTTGPCEPDNENGAHCVDNSGNNGDKCICENVECMNCAVIKTICVNGMSMGRLDVYTDIDGYMASGGHITNSNLVGTDCKKKCVQDTETTAHCLEDDD